MITAKNHEFGSVVWRGDQAGKTRHVGGELYLVKVNSQVRCTSLK